MFICEFASHRNPKLATFETLPTELKNKIICYITNPDYEFCACPSIAKDLLSGNELTGGIYGFTDGEFDWTNEIIYLFEHYDIKLYEKFINKVKNAS